MAKEIVMCERAYENKAPMGSKMNVGCPLSPFFCFFEDAPVTLEHCYLDLIRG
jgi:hypothetical protein